MFLFTHDIVSRQRVFSKSSETLFSTDILLHVLIHCIRLQLRVFCFERRFTVFYEWKYISLGLLPFKFSCLNNR